MIKTARKFSIIAFPSITAISGVFFHFYNDIVLLDWIFKVSLSGTVGIWTNYFAIKMLFRPLNRTAFGRQGLIPARRDEISEAIASAVSEELLNADTIINYIEENDLVGKAADRTFKYAHKLINDSKNKTKLINAIARYIHKKGLEHTGKLLKKAAELIRIYSQDKLSFEKVWKYLKNVLELELKKPETVHLLTMTIKQLVEKNSSAISIYINSTLEEWINSQNFIIKNALKFGKGFLGIDKNKIKKIIMEKVNKRSFFLDMVDLIEKNINSITIMGDDPAVKGKFLAFFKEQKQQIDEWIRTDGVNTVQLKIVEYLESEIFWKWLEEQLDITIDKIREFAEKKIQSDEFRESTGDLIIKFAGEVEIKKIVQKKVNEFELSQLETLITKVSGENLNGIELFGGLLGAIAGLTLISQWFILGIPALFIVLGVIERSLSTKTSAI